MGIFSPTADEVARERELDERNMAEEFDRSPVGRARGAYEAGVRIFQAAIDLSNTEGTVRAMDGAYSETVTSDHSKLLEAIEAEGWALQHANYVYRPTGSVSRDKFFSSGQEESVTGEIVGIYIFRRNDG